MAKQTKKPRPPQFDTRVDQAGAIKSLVKSVLEPLIDALKRDYHAGDYIYCEHFEATFQGNSVRHISKASILKLFEAKQITRSQFLAMLGDDAIAVPKAERILPGGVFRKLCRVTSGEPRLMVKELDDGAKLDVGTLTEQLWAAVFATTPVDPAV